MLASGTGQSISIGFDIAIRKGVERKALRKAPPRRGENDAERPTQPGERVPNHLQQDQQSRKMEDLFKQSASLKEKGRHVCRKADHTPRCRWGAADEHEGNKGESHRPRSVSSLLILLRAILNVV